ncbi:MoaD/ThiS family protein [Calycomorphotria hydatis]|uniref:Molybdopterin synthase sulfur carrier subunit n=1 Tax=Calycomorphotria hydatis TaxID=2528027 RepID=A0A517T886_9PLAN|nr:MoaD/ThiS family protein [Calycomorphotria hydatis]QDT64584.1 Molybdopterin synthase sulfur carrier subunit [Calycomorphotria hydatis]
MSESAGTITVLFFAAAKDAVGTQSVQIEIPHGTSVGEFRHILSEKWSQLKTLPRLLIAIDESYASDKTIIPLNSTVACFPPVSGG